jgi:N-acetylglucosaminyldiphosphoundecaprenol N-acetyl-beta-D-mannosaminyltransferase
VLSVEDHAVRLGELTIRGLSREQLLAPSERLSFIITVNAEYLVMAKQQPRMKQVCADNLAVIDGQIPYLLARAVNRGTSCERISGSEFVYDLCKLARSRSLALFLLGGEEGVNRRAVEKIRDRFAVNVDGFSPPLMSYPFDAEHNAKLLDEVRRRRPQILLTALVTPKGVFWIDDNKRALEECGVRWTLEFGGGLDMVAGRLTKAPWPIPQIGMEWLWRTVEQPSRLGRLARIARYFPAIVLEDVLPLLWG